MIGQRMIATKDLCSVSGRLLIAQGEAVTVESYYGPESKYAWVITNDGNRVGILSSQVVPDDPEFARIQKMTPDELVCELHAQDIDWTALRAQTAAKLAEIRDAIATRGNAPRESEIAQELDDRHGGGK